MSTQRSDILLHPVRLRIILAVAGDEVTTADIARGLPDVPPATLYRHIAKLADAGMLDVVGERQARGAVERTFRVNVTRASISADDVAGMSSEEHLEAFTTFVGILIETYGRYLKAPEADPSVDGVSFRQVRMWLTDSELESLVGDVSAAFAGYVDLEESPERTPRLLSTILMPEPEVVGDR
jgi:DNA-binding transcriptional ArsR family regulator